MTTVITVQVDGKTRSKRRRLETSHDHDHHHNHFHDQNQNHNLDLDQNQLIALNFGHLKGNSEALRLKKNGIHRYLFAIC